MAKKNQGPVLPTIVIRKELPVERVIMERLDRCDILEKEVASLREENLKLLKEKWEKV